MSTLERQDLRQSQPADQHRSVSRPDSARPEQRMTTLQLAISIFCAFIGSLMLVAPHQFGGPLWTALGEHLYAVGSLLFLAGAALTGCLVLGLARRWIVASHLVAAGALLLFVYNTTGNRLFAGAALYTVLALGVALAPFVNWLETPARRDGDFFALVFGAVTTTNGLIMLFLPEQFASAVYAPLRPYLWPSGAALLIAGLALVAAQLWPALPTVLHRAFHLFILVPSVPFVLLISMPLVSWSGILFYGGFSLLVASLPWTGPRLKRVDPHSFSVRLSFTLAVVAALPLVVVTGAVTSDQERVARADGEASLETLATSLASDVSHYMGSYRSSMVALASYPGLQALTREDQEAALRSFVEAFPDTLSIGITDATGQQTARSDGLPLASNSGMPGFEEVRRTNAISLGIRTGRDYPVPLFIIAAPIRAPHGGFGGALVSGITSERVAAVVGRVSRPGGTRVYLVDAAGRAIAHPDQSLVASFADLSSGPPVASVVARPAHQGVVSFARPNGDVLAAFAQVPDFGWAVVVERPASDALAGVREGRNAAFALLLSAVLLAVVAGTLIARKLSAPLAALAFAADRFARGDSATSLPRGGASEIQEFVGTFGEMRERLVTEAAERERLLQDLQRRAVELDVANKELEAFAYSVAHDLRSPVRHMDGFSKALMERYADKLDERGLQYLQFVREGSIKMAQLVDDLLALTGVTRGELHRTTVDLSEMARSIAADLRHQQPRRQTEFVIAPQVVADGDPRLLRVVLENLLGNAWKFTSRTERATIEFGTVQQDGRPTYFIRDDGAGFDMAYAHKLFRAFERLHSADEFPGTGVGLATVERIVRRHGGRVWGEGEVDKGAKFYFTLR
ncbi:MAG: hypothetical protein HY675_16360 [Chloroflexi bacterium]|nr:hypothetical protein [Chloroflexota bacterium]